MEGFLAMFFCDGAFIYGVPNKRNEKYKYCLDLGIPYVHYVRRPSGNDFSIKLVLRVGYKIIAICDTLGAVYYWCYGADNWERRNIVLFMEYVGMDKTSGAIMFCVTVIMVVFAGVHSTTIILC